MAERKYNLAVLRFPGNDSEHPASSGWAISHQVKWHEDPRIGRVIHLRRSDTPITMVRNLLVKRALEEGADYILMIDSDMQPDVEPDGRPFWDSTWEWMMERREREESHRSQLYQAEQDWQRHRDSDPMHWNAVPHAQIQAEVSKAWPPATVAAPYCGPPPHEVVYAMKWCVPEGNTPELSAYKLELFDRDHAASFSGIFEVAALATGLILYDARVFHTLPPPWFAYEFTDEFQCRKATTEDIYQTRNASLLGMPQFCNWDAWAGHIKPKVVRRPRPVCVDSVPDAMADAIRRGIRGDRRVIVIRSDPSGEGGPQERPAQIVGTREAPPT